MILYEQRASTVLFNLIRSHPLKGPFLLPANICPIVPMVFFKARRSFEFIDIAPNTLCMDHDRLIKRWVGNGAKPAGLIYVRTYGAIFDTSDVFEKIKQLSPNALIVDDRCLCPPDFSEILPNNTDAILFSTGYAKFVDIGFGGFGVIREEIPYVRSQTNFSNQDYDKMIRNYKSALENKPRFYYTDSDWLDTRFPKISLMAYKEMVSHELSNALEIKTQLNSIFASQLPIEIQMPNIFQSWRFNILVFEKTRLLKKIQSEGLYASGHYESLAYVFGLGHAPFAKKLHHHVINLFNDRYFSVDQALKIMDIITQFKPLNPGNMF